MQKNPVGRLPAEDQESWENRLDAVSTMLTFWTIFPVPNHDLILSGCWYLSPQRLYRIRNPAVLMFCIIRQFTYSFSSVLFPKTIR